MIMCKVWLILAIHLTLKSVCAQPPGALSHEALELRAMLKMALDQNRQLLDQNQRLKAIWSGIENMCSVITPSFKCQCPTPLSGKNKPLIEQDPAGHNSLGFKKIRDLPPPSVEFYRHDNGKLVNSASFNAINDKKPEKPKSPNKNPVYTVSLSPIADVLKDLNIAPYVDNTLERKSPATSTTPMPKITPDHHIGTDLMHEMLGPHSHQNPPIDSHKTGNGSSVLAILLEPLTGPKVKGHGHAHTHQDQHAHSPFTGQRESSATGNHKHFDLFNEVNGNPLAKDAAHAHGKHSQSIAHGTQNVQHGHTTGGQSPFDLMYDVGSLMDPDHLLGPLMEPGHEQVSNPNTAHGHIPKPDKSHRHFTDVRHGHLPNSGTSHGDTAHSEKPQGHSPNLVNSHGHLSKSEWTHGSHGAVQPTGLNSASAINHKHAQEFVLSPNSMSTKLILNDLLAATERSIHEKQLNGQTNPFGTAPSSQKKASHSGKTNSVLPTDVGVIEKLMFGTGPEIPMQSLDKVPKQNEVHQHQPTKTRKNKPTKPQANNKPTSAPQNAVPTTAIVTPPPTTTPRVVKNVKLSIKAVSSEGLVTNAISVTVRYTAPLDHTTEWLQLQENGATTRTSGVRSQMVGGSDSEYSSNMVFVDANATRHALFRLFGNNKSISIQFNLTELQLSGEQILPDFLDYIVNFNENVVAERNVDLEIDLEVRGSLSDNPELGHTEVFFTGLNTTTRPPTVFEIVHFNSQGVSVLLTSSTQNTSNMRITLKRPYINYGGILTVRLPQTVGGYLAGYYYGHMIRVLEFYTQEVIPYGNLGVYYLPKTTIVREPSQSILCAAMGNPPPDVVILKVAPDGKERETLTETIMLDTVTNMKSLTLYADKPEASEGNYICRASIGSEVVNSTTEVVVVQPPEFDDIQTGVTSNTSGRVTISCKATGRPRPELEMRLYEDHGPNLAKTGIYKTSLLTPNNTTAQLTLTVSPNDREIHTVVCVAKQNIPNSKEHYKQVVVFPKSEDYTNWYLYNRLQSMATGW